MKKKFLLLTLLSTCLCSMINAQNIGIGTNTPQEKLHVAGTLRVDDLQASLAASAITDKMVWVDANGKVYAFPAGTAGKILGMNGAGVLAWLDAGLANTLNNGQIWIGNGANLPQPQTASGDAVISNIGVITIQDDAVDGTDITISAETTGSLMYFNGTDWVNIGIGAVGQVLTVSGGVPSWQNLPIATTGDLTTTTAGLTVTGGVGAVNGAGTTVNVATNALNQNGLVPGPTAGNALQVWGTDVSGNPGWVNVSTVLATNDVIAGVGNNAVSITAGANQVVGASDVTVNVANNGLAQDGVVSGTSALNVNDVWGTDATGTPAWRDPNALLTKNDVVSGNPAISIINGVGQVVGGLNVTINPQMNALNQNGYVPGPTGANINQVWGTDALGNPAWTNPTTLISVDNGLYYNGVAGKVRQGGALVENTNIPQGNFDMVYDLTGVGNFEVRKSGTTDLFVSSTNSNVGIGTVTPDASAMLDISSVNRGLLVPRIALTATNSALPVAVPLTSLFVYNTATAGVAPNNVIPGYYYWDGTIWQRFDTGNNVGDWKLDGNTNGAMKSIGTNDNFDLPFETNGVETMRLTTGGKLLLGTTTSGPYPWARLELADDTGANSDMTMRVGGVGYLGLIMQAGSGTIAAPAVKAANGTIGLYDFQAHNGTFYQSVANMYAVTGTGFAAGNTLGRLGFGTKNTTDGGPVERLTIAPDGAVGVNITTPLPYAKLHVNGGGFLITNNGLGAAITNPPALSADNTDFNLFTRTTRPAPNNAASDFRLYIEDDATDAFSIYGNSCPTCFNLANSRQIISFIANGNIGVNNADPLNKLDIVGGAARTGTHPTGRALYVTGTYGPGSNGVEFRHDNGTQGIGIGYNTIYATGSNANQDLGINALGTGVVSLQTGGNERLRVVAGGSTTSGKLELWGGYLDNVPTPNYVTLEMNGLKNVRLQDNFSIAENLSVGFPYTQHKIQVAGNQAINNMIDQYTTNSGSFWVPNAGTRWQSFTAGQTGSWTELHLAWLGGAGTTVLNIYAGEGNTGTLLSTFNINKAPGLQTYVLPVAIPVTGGNQYTFEVMDISGQLWVGTQNNGGIYSGNSAGDWWFEIILATGTSSAFTVTGAPLNGNVGIHTSTPTRAILELNDMIGNTNAIFGGNLAGVSLVSSWPAIYFNSYHNASPRPLQTGFSSSIAMEMATGRITFRTHASGAADAAVGSNDRMSILNNGMVGIGTTAPDQLLSVNGNASKVGGGAWAAFSDRRLKKDIKTFEDGLATLMQINPVSFQYNGLGGYPANGKNYIGVIAQEVQKVAPYMIETVSKKMRPEDTENTDLLMYDASALTYIIVNAVKEQQQQIESQQQEIERLNTLVAKMEALEARMTALDGQPIPMSQIQMANPTISAEHVAPTATMESNTEKAIVPTHQNTNNAPQLDEAVQMTTEQLKLYEERLKKQ